VDTIKNKLQNGIKFKIVPYRIIIQYAVLLGKKNLRKNYEISSAPNGFVTDSPH
jgi:hypothetical protein